MNNGPPVAPLKPLQVKCTDTDCASDLHCFKSIKRKAAPPVGACRSCGVQLIDWRRIHQRDLMDVTHTFEALRREFIRHHMWHKPIDRRAEIHARRKGRVLLRVAAERRIRASVASAQPTRDGRQTPFEGNLLYYAQHATATCCRTCMEYWHNIPKGRDLSEPEIGYCVDLVMRYVADRMPHLPDDPETISRAAAAIQEPHA